MWNTVHGLLPRLDDFVSGIILCVLVGLLIAALILANDGIKFLRRKFFNGYKQAVVSTAIFVVAPFAIFLLIVAVGGIGTTYEVYAGAKLIGFDLRFGR